MKVNDILVGNLTELILRPEENDDFDVKLNPGDELRLLWQSDWEQVLLSTGTNAWAVSGDDPRQQNMLLEIISQNQPYLCWVDDIRTDNGVTKKIILSVRDFSAQYLLPNDEKINN